MAEKDARPIGSGDRFEDKDWRNEGRVVSVVGWNKLRGKFRVVTDVNPHNPDTVGRHSFVSESTLREKYRRISR